MAKNRKRLKVRVLMGGPSSEHDVSLATGWNVIDNLDRSKYEPVGIKITRNKEWIVRGRKTDETKALADCDIVFNALHGIFGEDGKIQALLEYHGKKYTGSGIIASALAMNKFQSRDMFKLSSLQVPKTLKVKKGENYQALLNVFVNKIAGFPVVVKPCSNGSSIGIGIVAAQSQLASAIKSAFKVEDQVLVEEFIDGTEVTCGVLENFNGQALSALPVTQIMLKKGHKFFNYSAKYKVGHSDEITPAQINPEMSQRIQETAVKAHQILDCRGYSRSDMIIKGEKIYILETNTLPGLTKNSLLPKAALAAGLNFEELLDLIISASLA